MATVNTDISIFRKKKTSQFRAVRILQLAKVSTKLLNTETRRLANTSCESSQVLEHWRFRLGVVRGRSAVEG